MGMTNNKNGIFGEPKKGIIYEDSDEGITLKYDPNTQYITFWNDGVKYEQMDCSFFSDWSSVVKELQTEYGIKLGYIKDFSPKQMELLKKLEDLLVELDANGVFLVHQTELANLSAYNIEGFTGGMSVLYDTNEIPNDAVDVTDSMYMVDVYLPHQYKSCDKVLGWNVGIV
jgi:hypothetical protein